MKKLFTYIAIFAAAVACTDELYGPEETPLTPDSAGSVEIAFTDVTDDSFKVTVTPSGNVSYYSYLVDQSATAVERDAATLYKVGYKSVAQGTVKYTEEAPSYSFVVKATPNTTYQVYAVAGSQMGIVGTVVSKSVKTSDTVAPAYESYVTEENQVVFTFSEAVTATAAAASIKVTYYAPYSAAFKNAATPAGEVTVPADSITVAGTEATIAVPGLPTGCYWTISIPEGAFVDAVGQKLPGYASSYVLGTDGKPAAKGFHGEVSYVELPMLGELDLDSFSDWTQMFVIPMETKYAPAGYSSKNFVKVIYESPNKVVEHTLTPNVHYGITSLGFVVALPEQPEYGANVTISVPAAAFYDIFGNDCEAWEATLIHSYGYTLADVLGTYSGEATSYFNGATSLTLTVSESDNPEEGNIMLTGSYLGLPIQNPIYGNFDCVSGVLRVYDWQHFLTHPTAGPVLFAVNNEIGYVDFKVPQSGVITSPSDWFGAYIYNAGGWYDIFTDCTLVRAETSASAVTSVPEIKVLHVGRYL